MTRLKGIRGTIAIVLMLVILGNIAVPASAVELAKTDPDPASASISEEAAKKIVKAALSLPQDFKFWDSEFINRRGDSMAYPAWHLRGVSEQEMIEFIVDSENGDLLALEVFSYPPVEPSFSPKYTREHAMAAAKAFIQKAIPSTKNLSLIERPWYGLDTRFQTPLFGPAAYAFSFELAYQGIPLAGHLLNIQLNAAGKITKLEYTGTMGKVAARTSTISVDAASKIWADSIRMGLVYERRPDGDDSEFGPGEWKLLYRPYGEAEAIDAVNGNPYSFGFGDEFDPANLEAVVAAEDRFVPTTIDSEDEALRVVSGDLFQQGIDWKAHKLDSEQWSLEFHKEYTYGNARIDARTGRLIEYHVYSIGHGTTVEAVSRITVGKAKDIADRFMNAYVPDFADHYKRKSGDTPSDTPMMEAEQIYQKVHRGIVVWDVNAQVTIDGNGKVIEFTLNDEQVDDKALDALIPTLNADKAKKMLLNAYRMELVYVNDTVVSERGFDFHQTPMKLYYIPEDQQPYSELSGVIDAVKGVREPADPDFNRVRGGPLPSVYKTHPSAKALQLMLDHGVIRLDKSGAMNPNQAVSRVGFWEMLSYGVLFGRTIFVEDEAKFADTAALDAKSRGFLQYAVDRQWLKANPSGKFNPNGKLTREQMAVWLTTVIGYDKVSLQLAKNPIVTNLKDAGKIGNRGSVALMLKLGLMQASGGQFKPRDPVKLAEAAETFKRLAEKQAELDYPIYSTEDSVVTSERAGDF